MNIAKQRAYFTSDCNPSYRVESPVLWHQDLVVRISLRLTSVCLITKVRRYVMAWLKHCWLGVAYILSNFTFTFLPFGGIWNRKYLKLGFGTFKRWHLDVEFPTQYLQASKCHMWYVRKTSTLSQIWKYFQEHCVFFAICTDFSAPFSLKQMRKYRKAVITEWLHHFGQSIYIVLYLEWA